MDRFDRFEPDIMCVIDGSLVPCTKISGKERAIEMGFFLSNNPVLTFSAVQNTQLCIVHVEDALCMCRMYCACGGCIVHVEDALCIFCTRNKAQNKPLLCPCLFFVFYCPAVFDHFSPAPVKTDRAVRIQQTNQIKVNLSSINQSTERFTMKVCAWLINLIHRRKNCPTGMIFGWVQKGTEHRGTIQYLYEFSFSWWVLITHTFWVID